MVCDDGRMPRKTPQLSVDQIADVLRRADLDPADWDAVGIATRTNSWIADNRTELTDAEVKTWSAKMQGQHYDEFGALAAVDFFEQCVIETGPDCPLAGRASTRRRRGVRYMGSRLDCGQTLVATTRTIRRGVLL
jgi:hypothetical protein